MTLAEVGDPISLSVEAASCSCDDLLLFFTVPYSSFHQNDYHPFRIIHSHPLTLQSRTDDSSCFVPRESLGCFSLPGYYDWVVRRVSTSEVLRRGRFVVLPKGTRSHCFYEVPSDLEIAKRADPAKATKSTFSFLLDMIPSLADKGVDVVSIGVSSAHSSSLHVLQDDAERDGLRLHATDSADSSPSEFSDSSARVGLALQSSESEISSEGEGVTITTSEQSAPSDSAPFSSPNGVQFGTADELRRVVTSSFFASPFTRSLREHRMELMLSINASVSHEDRQARTPVLYDSGAGLVPHPGTDGYETQWESEVLPNYRLVAQRRGREA